MYLRVLLVANAVLSLLPALLVIAKDPFRVWHDVGWAEDLYSKNQRYQNAGIIRRFLGCEDCADTVVMLGTSLSENTSLTDLRETTGHENVVRLLAMGSTPLEQKYTLEHALGTGNVSLVIWEVFRNYVLADYNQFPQNEAFPAYLYNSTVLDDSRYLFNHTAVSVAARLTLGITRRYRDLDAINSWHSDVVETGGYRRWNTPENIELMRDRVAPRIEKWAGTEPDWGQQVPVYEDYILPIVADNPDVRFVFFVPPVSLIQQGTDMGEVLSGQLVLRQKLAELAERRANASLFVFDAYEPLVADMAYYKDAKHFSQPVSRWVLEQMMAENELFQLQPAQIKDHGERLWSRTLNHVPFSSCESTPNTCGDFDAGDSDWSK
jgi:hypothetical protein